MAGRAELWTKLLVAPLAKAVLKKAGLDEAVDSGVALLNEAARGMDADTAKRKAAELTGDLAADIVRRHARLFAEDGTDVDAEAVAEALTAVFAGAAEPKGLLSRNLDPARLARDLARVPVPAAFRVQERELYDAVLPDLAQGVVTAAAELKGFELSFRRELLERQDDTNRRLGEVERLARGDERRATEWERYETRYREHLATVNNHLELFSTDLGSGADTCGCPETWDRRGWTGAGPIPESPRRQRLPSREMPRKWRSPYP